MEKTKVKAKKKQSPAGPPNATSGLPAATRLTASPAAATPTDTATIHPQSPSPAGWFVYILQCADGSLYTGVTTDPVRRLAEHNGLLPGGAKYTACRRPVQPVYLEELDSRSPALKREWAIKHLDRPQKKTLIANSDRGLLDQYFP